MLGKRMVARLGIGAAASLALVAPVSAMSQEQQEVSVADTEKPEAQEGENNGTDPTRPIRTASVQYEHLDLRGGFNSDIVTVNYTQPIGSGRSSVKLEAPFASVDVLGNKSMALGDVSVKYTNIPVVTREYGIVLGAEMIFDTADRPELGTGQNVFKPSVIYAKFLKNGSIIAPSLVHSISVWGSDARAPVNVTTFDLYYVPRLSNPKLYMTVDPAMNFDWENNNEYPALAVTLGYRLGKMLGGNGQMFIKPSATFFEERPTDWGVKVGFQVLGF